jgi:diphosphomevalonate decarboxylase
VNRQATAVAHPNIALVKYWGKRDETLILPHQSSLSLTLGPLRVRTSVEIGVARDEVILNGQAARGTSLERVVTLARRVTREPVRVISEGNFPVAAGLASSAAGFAALSVALRAAAGFPNDVVAASRLARMGSGSACRSVQGGFCVWDRGVRADGEDSFARQLAPSSHWPELRMVVAVISEEEKEVSSRDGMRHTVETSAFYPAWVSSAESDISTATEAISGKDLEALGLLAEKNAWRMHASALGANPAVCYLIPETLKVIESIRRERLHGLQAYFTLDAGPNPVLLTTESQVDRLVRFLTALGAKRTLVCVPGDDASVVPA